MTLFGVRHGNNSRVEKRREIGKNIDILNMLAEAEVTYAL